MLPWFSGVCSSDPFCLVQQLSYSDVFTPAQLLTVNRESIHTLPGTHHIDTGWHSHTLMHYFYGNRIMRVSWRCWSLMLTLTGTTLANSVTFICNVYRVLLWWHICVSHPNCWQREGSLDMEESMRFFHILWNIAESNKCEDAYLLTF